MASPSTADLSVQEYTRLAGTTALQARNMAIMAQRAARAGDVATWRARAEGEGCWERANASVTMAEEAVFGLAAGVLMCVPIRFGFPIASYPVCRLIHPLVYRS